MRDTGRKEEMMVRRIEKEKKKTRKSKIDIINDLILTRSIIVPQNLRKHFRD